MSSALVTAQDKALRWQAKNRLHTISGDINLEGTLWTPTTQVKAPRFSRYQRVCFIGGIGTILHCRPESGTWTYTVEMELGPEPDMGRVGSETRILLQEADIQKVMK